VRVLFPKPSLFFEGDEMISKKRLLLTEDGKVVEAGNPLGVRLLVGAGGAVPSEYVGLVKEYEAANQESPAEVDGVEDEAEEVDPDAFKKEELIAKAEELGIEFKSSMTKAELADAINEKLQEGE
jgi:hypothetical protein